MKTTILLLAAAVTLSACSRNPEPAAESTPSTPAASTEAAPAASGAEAAPAATSAEAAAAETSAEPATAQRLSDEETMRLGREAVELVFASEIDSLWTRFDSNMRTQIGSADDFRLMTGQIFAQIGTETRLVEEEVIALPQQPGISVYRRQAHYAAIGQDTNLIVAFNADGSIAGINIQPAQ